MPRRRTRIVLLWLCGVLAAAQFGKFSALVPVLSSRFDLDLPEAGLLVSLVEVGGASLGFVAGMALPMIGARRALVSGLGLLAVTTVIETVTERTSILFAARGLEGLGYLLVVVAAPTMIVAATMPGRRRDGAMVLWSTFVPVGSGLGSIVTGLVAGVLGASTAMLLWAFTALAMIAAVARYPGVEVGARRVPLPAPGAWLLSAGFGFYTLFLCAIVALMPAFLHDRHGVGLAAASAIAGMVAMSALPGSLLALAAIRVLTGQHRRLQPFFVTALVIATPLSSLIFRVGSTLAAAVIAALTLLLAGIARAVIFTRVPALCGGTSPDDPRIASAQGLLTQFGALGAMAGPPIGAALVDRWSWPALGTGIAILIAALLTMMLAAERAHRMHETSQMPVHS